jgi:hypothetical protein
MLDRAALACLFMAACHDSPRADAPPNAPAVPDVISAPVNNGRTEIEDSAEPLTEGFVVEVALEGGRGWVSSAPRGLSCASHCRAHFPLGSKVQLYARGDDDGSARFIDWGGDADCLDGVIESDAHCTARFVKE